MTLSTEDRAVLAHVVIDPDAWWAHAQAMASKESAEAQAKIAALDALVADGKQIDPRQRARLEVIAASPEAHAAKLLAEKIARWKPSYDTERVRVGYKTRTARDVERTR